MADLKPSELHFTAVNWLTGLAPAAAGAATLLLVDQNTSAPRAFWLAALVLFLMLGFVYGTLTQLYALNAMAREGKASGEDLGRRDKYQRRMLAALYLSATVFVAGVFVIAFERRETPRSSASPAGWRVSAEARSKNDETIMISSADDSEVVLLRRKQGSDDWVAVPYAKPRTPPVP